MPSFPTLTGQLHQLTYQVNININLFWNKPLKYEFQILRSTWHFGTVKLGNKERFDKEQIGIKELSMDYQPFYTINLLLDKELLSI